VAKAIFHKVTFPQNTWGSPNESPEAYDNWMDEIDVLRHERE
jgi:hypothetical protein